MYFHVYAGGKREGCVGDCVNERLQDAFRNAFGSRENDRWSSMEVLLRDLEITFLLILKNFAKIY